MKPNKSLYKNYTKAHARPSHWIADTLKAFVFGGLICLLGQVLLDLYAQWMQDEKMQKSAVSVTLIFLSCLFTALGIYDHLAKHAGAGFLVPITGFANATISPALDSKSEGFILGVGAKMFTIAGPVIVYGTVASVLYGIIYWITTLF